MLDCMLCYQGFKLSCTNWSIYKLNRLILKRDLEINNIYFTGCYTLLPIANLDIINGSDLQNVIILISHIVFQH